MAASAGVQLSGTQLAIDSSQKKRTLYHVRVQAEGVGDIRGIATLLQLLEGGDTPLVSVTAFSVLQSEPNAPSNHAETLHVTFILDALARRDEL